MRIGEAFKWTGIRLWHKSVYRLRTKTVKIGLNWQKSWTKQKYLFSRNIVPLHPDSNIVKYKLKGNMRSKIEDYNAVVEAAIKVYEERCWCATTKDMQRNIRVRSVHLLYGQAEKGVGWMMRCMFRLSVKMWPMLFWSWAFHPLYRWECFYKGCNTSLSVSDDTPSHWC